MAFELDLFMALEARKVSVAVADPELDDCPLVFVNSAFCQLTGYEAEECVGRNCRFLQQDPLEPEAAKRLREAIETRRDCDVILTNRRKDGGLFKNHLFLGRIDRPDGAPLLIGCQFAAERLRPDVIKVAESARDDELAEAARSAIRRSASLAAASRQGVAYALINSMRRTARRAFTDGL